MSDTNVIIRLNLEDLDIIKNHRQQEVNNSMPDMQKKICYIKKLTKDIFIEYCINYPNFNNGTEDTLSILEYFIEYVRWDVKVKRFYKRIILQELIELENLIK